MNGFRAVLVRAIFAAAVAATAATPTSFAQVTDTADDGALANGGPLATPPVSTVGSPQSILRVGTSGRYYFRAGVGLDWSEETRFMDEDCLSTSPAALYGCGTGPDGAPRSSRGDFGTMLGFEVGFGYVAAPFLRLEGAVQHRPSVRFEGRANFLDPARRQDVTADMSVDSIIFAAYLDLPELGLPRLGPFSPFVGAGAGLSRIDIEETRQEYPRTTTIVPGGRRFNLAWMLTAGVASPLGKNLTLDLAWRYTDFGMVETGRGRGYVVWRDGSRPPLNLDLAETRARVASHGIWASVRYAY